MGGRGGRGEVGRGRPGGGGGGTHIVFAQDQLYHHHSYFLGPDALVMKHGVHLREIYEFTTP